MRTPPLRHRRSGPEIHQGGAFHVPESSRGEIRAPVLVYHHGDEDSNVPVEVAHSYAALISGSRARYPRRGSPRGAGALAGDPLGAASDRRGGPLTIAEAGRRGRGGATRGFRGEEDLFAMAVLARKSAADSFRGTALNLHQSADFRES